MLARFMANGTGIRRDPEKLLYSGKGNDVSRARLNRNERTFTQATRPILLNSVCRGDREAGAVGCSRQMSGYGMRQLGGRKRAGRTANAFLGPACLNHGSRSACVSSLSSAWPPAAAWFLVRSANKYPYCRQVGAATVVSLSLPWALWAPLILARVENDQSVRIIRSIRRAAHWFARKMGIRQN